MVGMDGLSASQFQGDVADRFRRGQLRDTVEQMRVMLLGNTVFAPILAFETWTNGDNMKGVVWTAAMVVFSWWLFFSWRRVYHTIGSRADMARFVAETFVNAMFWVIGMALFFPIADDDAKTIVMTVMAGSLALGTIGFSRAPAAGFTYLGVMVAGTSFIAMSSYLKENNIMI